MIYVYCFLISLATTLAVFVGIAFAAKWAIPRYGAMAMRMAMGGGIRNPYAPPVQVSISGGHPPDKAT